MALAEPIQEVHVIETHTNGGQNQPHAAMFTEPQPEDTYILGDIEAFLQTLEHGTMQAQWVRDQARAQAWIEDGHLPHACDASED